MRKLILTCAILLLSSPVEAQSFKWYPVERDFPNSKYGKFFKYDKADHFATSALSVMIIPTKKYNLDFWTTIVLGVGYEIYDGYDWRRSGGFSVTDLIFNIAGAITGVWIKDLCHTLGISVLVNRNGISINF